MAFDPDAYLAAKTGAPADDFDPDAYLASKGAAPAPAPAPVDMGPAARRARAGLAPGERELTSEQAGTSAGMVRAQPETFRGRGAYTFPQPLEPAASPEDYVTAKDTPGGGRQIKVYPHGNPNEMADPLVQMGTASALGMAAGAGPTAALRAVGAAPGLAAAAGAATEGAVANKAMGGDLDTGAALGLLPFAIKPAARATATAAKTVASKLAPNAEKALKNARGWVVKDIAGDIKSASTPTARKQLADDAEHAATIVLKDKALDKAIDRADSGNLDRLQEAQGLVKERLRTTGAERIGPQWKNVDKALPGEGVRSGDLVDFLANRSEDLRATGLTGDAAEADALDGIAGKLKTARDWGGGKRFDPKAPVQGGALDGMETGKAIELLEKQQTGPTAGQLGDEIKRLREEATTESFNPDTIVPAQQVQRLWSHEAGNAYGSQGGINGTVTFERKLDVASHVREFRDSVLAEAAQRDPRAVAEVRAANADHSALKRIETVLDQRINHAKANAQGASVPVGLVKAAKEIKHSPHGWLIGQVPEAMIAGKRAFDKWIARRAVTSQQNAAVRKIFTAGPSRGPAIRAAVGAGVPSSIAMWAGRAADGGAKAQDVATNDEPSPAVAEAP